MSGVKSHSIDIRKPTWRTRSALTAVVSNANRRVVPARRAKLWGFPKDVTGSLASLIWGWIKDGVAEREGQRLNLNLLSKTAAA